MFTTYFKMVEQPFAERIPVKQILQHDRLTQGLARLQYMLCQGTIALITGMTGVGKSVLIKLFLANLPQNQYLPVYIHFTHIKAAGLLNLIVRKLGEKPQRAKEQRYQQLVDKAQKINSTVILIIDEAHLLESEALTDMRLLVSSAIDSAPPVKIVMAGQEKLNDLIKMTSHADLAQRVSVHCRLTSLTKAQTAAYIDFQMKCSGASEKIFEPEVKDLIHEYANGIPRQINNIAIACLINASINKTQKISLDILNQTMPELK